MAYVHARAHPNHLSSDQAKDAAENACRRIPQEASADPTFPYDTACLKL